MKILAIGDLHGNIPEIYFDDFDAILAPGDFCSDAPRKYMFEALRLQLQNPQNKTKWYDLAGKKKAKEMVKKSLSDGRKVLEKLNSYDVPVYIVPGNWEWLEKEEWKFLKHNHYKRLTKGLKNITDVHNRVIDKGEYQIIGYGISSGHEYPQYKEDLKRFRPQDLKKIRKEYESQYKITDELFTKAKRNKPVLFLSHNVPFNTPIDKITNKDSPRYGYHYGSVIAREIIEKHQPLISIGGHMHEHFGKCKIGKTVCVNSGFGPYVNVLMELEGNEIKKLTFHRK